MLSSLKDSFRELRNYEHCEGEERYENISMFLVFFFFAHLQIFRLYCKLKAPEGKEGALYGKVHQTKRNYLRTQR